MGIYISVYIYIYKSAHKVLISIQIFVFNFNCNYKTIPRGDDTRRAPASEKHLTPTPIFQYNVLAPLAERT